MKLRVAHIITGLAIGGAERHLVSLLNAMSCEYRAAIVIGGVPSGPSFHQELDPGVDQYLSRIRRRALPIGLWRLVTLLKRIRVDVVHTHLYEASLYGAIAARMAGIPVVVTTEHGENRWKRPIHHWLERKVVSPLVDVRFCVSPQILGLRRDLDGVPANKLRLTVNGTLLPKSVPAIRNNELPVIGAVGRFIPEKDYPRLLLAMAELRGHGSRFKACIVGDGPEMTRVRDVVRELDLEETVELPGMVTDVGCWYRQFDIYVSASCREGQPLALLEAMAHGLPIVATNVGASAETLCDGVGGLIVPPENTPALVNALGRLLSDSNLRESLARNARNRVETKFSIEAVADSHLQCYGELLSTKDGPQRNPVS